MTGAEGGLSEAEREQVAEDDGPTHGCLGCLIDGHDHSCGFVAINAPRTTWNTSTKEDA